MRTPALTDLRIFIVPDCCERIQRHQCRLFGRGLIDRLQTAGDGFVILPRHVFQAVTHHMDDAQLDMDLREDAVYRIREALQTVHTGNQDVLKATVFQLRQHAQPELCAFIFGQPHAQQLFPAFGVDPQRQENSFVDYATILTNFYDDTVHVNNGIQRIQLSVLPLRNLLFYGIRDFGYQCGRHIGVVHFFEGGNNVASSHAFGVQG